MSRLVSISKIKLTVNRSHGSLSRKEITMTKKDYELIADGIAETHKNRLEWLERVQNSPEHKTQAEAAVKTVEQVAADISARLRRDNPMYSSHKFMSRAIFSNY